MASRAPANPERAATTRWRRLRLLRCALLACALLAWAACGLSYFVEWSAFTASPSRPYAVAPGSLITSATGPGGAPLVVERDETHLMFGHGGLYLHSNVVYTESFAQPNSDLSSYYLAWATVDGMFPRWPPWRLGWYAPGPVMGARLWLIALIPTIAYGFSVILIHPPVPPGYCRRCRYDLRGAVPSHDGLVTCPECGTQALATPPRP
jgi:hypothetical protein